MICDSSDPEILTQDLERWKRDFTGDHWIHVEVAADCPAWCLGLVLHRAAAVATVGWDLQPDHSEQ